MSRLGNFKTIPAAIILATAAGCSNEQIDLVGIDPLPALSATPLKTELDGSPSLLHGLDRQGWATVTVRVPRDQVAHPPTYAVNFRWQKDRDPWNPAYPTATAAIVDETDAGADVADGLTEPLVTAAMLVWAPIDMIFFTPPWEQRRSPSEPFMLVPDSVPAHLVDWFGAPDTAGDRTADPAVMPGLDTDADRQPHP
ncbi:MAG: hypothetical protein V3S08_11300 [Phycisphaerales bacterium]